MRRITLLLLLATACGEPMCKRECEKARPQLARDFAVQVDCDDPKWAIDDCPRCEQIFETDYGVKTTLACELDAGLAP